MSGYIRPALVANCCLGYDFLFCFLFSPTSVSFIVSSLFCLIYRGFQGGPSHCWGWWHLLLGFFAFVGVLFPRVGVAQLAWLGGVPFRCGQQCCGVFSCCGSALPYLSAQGRCFVLGGKGDVVMGPEPWSVAVGCISGAGSLLVW